MTDNRTEGVTVTSEPFKELRSQFGYTDMFYTPKDLNNHIEKYLGAMDSSSKIAGLTLAYGITNFYSNMIAEAGGLKNG